MLEITIITIILYVLYILKVHEHVAQGKSTSNAVVDSNNINGLRRLCPRKKWQKNAVCPHFVHIF